MQPISDRHGDLQRCSAPPPALPLRIAIIGTGRISRVHLATVMAYPDQVQVIAVCDVDRAAAEALVASLGYPVEILTDYRVLLTGPRTIDAAVLTLPHHLHFPIAKDFVEAGLPILVEKPLTCTLDETRMLRDLAAAQDVPVVAGQMWRFMPETVWLKRWIAADAEHFGALRTFNLTVWQNIYGYTGGPQNTNHWLLDGRKAGGGVVISVAIHQIDLVRFLAGSDYVRVTAKGRFEPPMIHGAESAAMVMLEMSNGAQGVLHADFKTPRIPYSEAMSLFGENGTIIQHPEDGQYHGRFRYATIKGRETVEFQQMYEDLDWVPGGDLSEMEADPFVNQLLQFASAIRNGQKPQNHVDQNFNTMACIQAIYDSMRSGRPVDVATE